MTTSPQGGPAGGNQPAKQVDRRGRSVYIWWAVALTLLALLGVFCWALVVPVLEVRSVLASMTTRRFWREQDIGDGFLRAEISQLGGSNRARSKVLLYLQAPKFIASERAVAIALLAACGKDSVPDLLRYLGDDDEYVRAGAAMCLCESEDAEVIAALVMALEDSSPTVKIGAAVALGHIGPPAEDALPSLQTLLNDSNENVRGAAAEAQEKIKGEEAPK